MPDAEISDYIAHSRSGYIDDRVASGDDVDVATRSADDQIAAAFPNGKPAPGHRLFSVERDGEKVGALWLGLLSSEQPTLYWVWDITIDAPHQGRGYGRETMLLAEDEARKHGATDLGLNVFGTNSVARHLYESLGYAPMSIRMTKKLYAS
jgi:ribosomal protein S18 acetylase RimI-like enzyme